MLKGIDISKHQGEFPWNAVIAQNSGADKISFAFARAGSGLTPLDPQFERNYQEAKRLGVPLGTYFFFYCANKNKHLAELQMFKNDLEGKTFELPVFLDYEATRSSDNYPVSMLNKKTLTDYILDDYNQLKALGFKVGLYASKSWLTGKIDTTRLPDDLTIWLAHYTTKQGDPNVRSDYKGRYEIWQYTSVGRVAGYNASLDLNLALDEFWAQEDEEETAMDGFETPVKTYSRKTEGKMKLTANLRVSEFACKDGSDQVLIDTYLLYLAQKIRDHFDSPLLINSGYRTKTYNDAVGGAKESQHIQGRAIDFNVFGKKPKEVYDWCNTWHTGGLGLYRGWVHIDTGPNRRWNG